MDQTAPQTPPPDEGFLSGWWTDLKTALAFLTRLPVAGIMAGTLSRAARAFPLVGLAVGLIGAVVFVVATWLSLPGLVASVLVVATTILITGAMHEDGLADVADGFGGGRDREGKLAIMRDSRTGSYGALALILSVLIRVAAIFLLTEPLIELGLPDEAGSLVAAVLIAVHAVSRAMLPAVMHRGTLARETGFAVAAGQPDRTAVYWSLGLGAVIALLALGFWIALIAILAAAAAAFILVQLARRQIGGYTGDVLGAVQQAAEITMLLAVLALQ